jgi:MFS family permease
MIEYGVVFHKFDRFPAHSIFFFFIDHQRSNYPMMELEEGNELLSSGKKTPSKESIIDQCIDNSDLSKTFWIAISLAMGNAADAVEIMCVGFIMSEMSDLSSTDKELLSSAVFMGMLFGGIFGGYISDSLGRKRVLLWCLLLNALAGFLSAFSPNIATLIVFRVIAGLGIGGSVPIVFSLGAELFPSATRGYYLSIIASFWMVGAIFVAFSAWIMLGEGFDGKRMMPGVTWRPFAVVSCIPAVVAWILTYYRIPESPRYLLTYHQDEEIVKILNSLSTVQITLQEFQIDSPVIRSASRENNNSTHSQEQNLHLHHHENNLFTTISLLFGEQFFRSTVTLLIIWFTLSFGSYGISTWISILFSDVGIGNAYAASLIYALANLPGNIVSLLFIDTIGRRWLLSIGMCLAGISILGFALDTKDAIVVVLFASLFNAFGVMGWNSLDCLSAEVFPTVARSSAMGLLAASGRLGAVAGQFVNGSLEKNIPLLLFVTCICSFVGGIVAWALPKDPAGTSLGKDIDRRVSIELERCESTSGSITSNPLQAGSTHSNY